MPTPPVPDEDFTLYITSGINKDFVPFCRVHLGEKQIGQLSPPAVRDLALQWLSAAEAASSDAMVARMFTEVLEAPLEVAAEAIGAMRQYREEADEAAVRHEREEAGNA